jgi:hypothetical protein
VVVVEGVVDTDGVEVTVYDTDGVVETVIAEGDVVAEEMETLVYVDVGAEVGPYDSTI